MLSYIGTSIAWPAPDFSRAKSAAVMAWLAMMPVMWSHSTKGA